MRVRDRDPLQPFASVVRAVEAGAVLWVISGFYSVLHHSNSGRVCVDVMNGGNDAVDGRWSDMIGPDVTAKSTGVTLCDSQPDAWQLTLRILIETSSPVLFLCVMLLFGQLIHRARRGGPFTAGTPKRLTTIGWVLVVGGYLAGVIKDSAELLLHMTMLRPEETWPAANDVLIFGLWTWSPALLLTGLGLLTVARILRVGVRMREDLVGMV